MLRETDPQPSLWEALLPAELKRLPAELAKIGAYLDDERFIRPWRALFDRRLGRPSVPVDTLLRLLYLKHRYGLGYESLCREVADSIGWRRFCRIGLEGAVPHPTTLVKLVRRAGPEVIAQLNTALVAKLANAVFRVRTLGGSRHRGPLGGAGRSLRDKGSVVRWSARVNGLVAFSLIG